jgi:hypothetical protein
MIRGVFITHESYFFMEKRGWSVILPLWYFKLYSTQNNMYCINIKYWMICMGSQKNIWWVLGLGPLEMKMGLGALPGPKHVELKRESSSSRGCWGARPPPRVVALSHPCWACTLHGLELLAQAQPPWVLG